MKYYTPTDEFLASLVFKHKDILSIENNEVGLEFEGACGWQNYTHTVWFKCPDEAFFLALLKSLDWIE